MSVPRNGRKKKEQPELGVEKPATAEQLFGRYMKAAENVRVLVQKLIDEKMRAENLATQLASQYGVYVSDQQPGPGSASSGPPAPPPARSADNADPDQVQEETPEGEYKPPHQGPLTAEAPQLGQRESAEVAEIRRNAGLSPEEMADAEALAADAGQKMANLQKLMGGKAVVIPSPSGGMGGAPAQEPDNSGGGPVEQKPVPEGD